MSLPLRKITITYRINDIWREWKSNMPLTHQRTKLKCIQQSKNIQLSTSNLLSSKKYPSKTKDLQKRFTELKGKQKCDSRLSSELIEFYINEGQYQAVDQVIKSTRELNKNFVVQPMVIKWYVDSCIKNNRLGEAEKIILNEVNMRANTKIFASTLIDLSIALADRGWHEKALDILQNTPEKQILTLQKGISPDSSRLLAHYVEKEDVDRLRGNVQISIFTY